VITQIALVKTVTVVAIALVKIVASNGSAFKPKATQQGWLIKSSIKSITILNQHSNYHS